MDTAQMTTAPAPATISTAWRSGSWRDSVARVKSNSPASNTKPTGKIALSCQLTRTEDSRKFSDDESSGVVWSLPSSERLGTTGARIASVVVVVIGIGPGAAD